MDAPTTTALFQTELQSRRQAQAAAATEAARERSEPPAKTEEHPTGRSIPLLASSLALVALVHTLLAADHAEKLTNLVLATLALWMLDIALCWHTVARWYWLHAAGNLVVTIFTWQDTVRTFYDPAASLSGQYSMMPAYVVPAIHIYHAAMFKCSRADIVHHVVFAGTCGPAGLFLKTGPVQNAFGMFVCGLPGGADYAMLAMVKHGWMSRLTEKVTNARINVWLRSPGLLFVAFAMLQASASYEPWRRSVYIFFALLCAVNGQYYMQVVVGNTFIKSREPSSPRAYNS